MNNLNLKNTLEKVFPPEVAHHILIYYFSLLHREKTTFINLFEKLTFSIFHYDWFPIPSDDQLIGGRLGGYSMCLFDPVVACEYYNRCNCCPRHQRNKAAIHNINGVDQPIIYTKHVIFDPNFRYDGRVDLDLKNKMGGSRGAKNSHWTILPSETLEIQEQNNMCFCNCRHKSRICVRHLLKKRHGETWEQLFHNGDALGIGPTNLTVGPVAQVEFFAPQNVEPPDNDWEDEDDYDSDEPYEPWENNSIESYEPDYY